MATVALIIGLLILLPILVCGWLHIEIPIPLPVRLRSLAESSTGGRLLTFLLIAVIVMFAMVLIDMGSEPKRQPRVDRSRRSRTYTPSAYAVSTARGTCCGLTQRRET